MLSHEYNLYKILSGKTKLEIDGKNIEVLPPSYEAVYDATLLYNKVYRRGFINGALSKDELSNYLIDRGLWSIEQEVELEKIPDQISNTKFDMYDIYTRFGDYESKRKVINYLSNRYNDLWSQKTQFDRYTIEGISTYHKFCFLICCGANLNYFEPNLNLDKLYYNYINNSCGDNEIRQIAKKDDWRAYWRGIKLGYRIFGDVLTKEQYSLISWSQFYDNVYESADCPDDTIIEDDDLLDGWCIAQKKKRKEEEKRKIGDRYGNANEIFIPVASPEQAAKINELNDGQAKMIRRQRENLIQKLGSVREQDMPDSKMEIKQQAMQEFKSRVRKR